jgi:hypothetical protein
MSLMCIDALCVLRLCLRRVSMCLCVCPAERAELEALRAQQLVCGSEDVGFLRYLAASYVSRGMHQQALQCLQRLTMLSPGEGHGCVCEQMGRKQVEAEDMHAGPCVLDKSSAVGASILFRRLCESDGSASDSRGSLLEVLFAESLLWGVVC